MIITGSSECHYDNLRPIIPDSLASLHRITKDTRGYSDLSAMPVIRQENKFSQFNPSFYIEEKLSRTNFGDYLVNFESKTSKSIAKERFSSERGTIIVERDGEVVLEYKYYIKAADRHDGYEIKELIVRNVVDINHTGDRELVKLIYPLFLKYIQFVSNKYQILIAHRPVKEPINRQAENYPDNFLSARWDRRFDPIFSAAGYQKMSTANGSWIEPVRSSIVKDDQPGNWVKIYKPESDLLRSE